MRLPPLRWVFCAGSVGAQDKRSHVQVGQRPFEMGYRAPSVMKDLIAGKSVPNVIYTGLDECTPETASKCIAK